MKYQKIEKNNYNLHIIKTNKFKSINLSINFKRKIKKDEITIRNFLNDLLINSSKKYPTSRDIEIETEELYDLGISSSPYKSGNYHIISFKETFLNEIYTEKNMIKKSIIFLLELIFNPNIKENKFDKKYFELIKKTLEEDIKSLKDDTKKYSLVRLYEEMDNGPLSYRSCGYLEDLDKITDSNLYDYYKTVIENDNIDIFIIGNIEETFEEIFDEYIPNRLNEGYGLNKKAVESIANQGYTLMITVDCGISAVEEVNYANELGIETIITDHHEPGSELPKALAVVDAKRKDNKYPFRNLAGVGVVFKLTQAISMKLGLEEKDYLKYLDIVCVGTISDIVPLVDENRVIVKLGLKLVEQTRNLGLRSILQASGYNRIDSTTVSFGIAPRINASGRMGHQEDALQLFLSKDINEVNELTQKLNEYNKIRQDTEKSIYSDAIFQIEQNNLAEKNTIVVMGKNWHHGVIGIVSSKITELYFKPSILLCE